MTLRPYLRCFLTFSHKLRHYALPVQILKDELPIVATHIVSKDSTAHVVFCKQPAAEVIKGSIAVEVKFPLAA